ncbi:hypothetical protein [Streptomyces sp. NPDC017890]|uniref:hypothetical protein n=1 Tax=Streptomyces sp. NPDC017890 TaxID=3365015 RepID=UPI0037BB90B9
MRSTRVPRARTLAVAAVATGLLAGGITATTTDLFREETRASQSADTITNASATRDNPICVLGREVRNVKFVKTVKVWPNEPGYVIAGWGPGQLRIDYKVETANKVSGTLGLSEGAISAAVGFDVTETIGKNFGYTAHLKKHAHYKLRAGVVYKQYQFDVYEKRGRYHWIRPTAARCYPTSGAGAWVKIGTETATGFWTTDHRLTKGRMAR